ncbi:MAG: DUF3795 domain-containing protein [Sedimentisphaerales bacterium]|nr:DUF3795 domain-containing protein [Sedimentisphaerales bacterium]
MEPIISKCGYRCDLCPAYETNLKSDADKQRMSDAWEKYCGFEVPAEAIKSCAGCAAGGGDETCTVRPCATEKNLDNCAHCEQFGCDKLKQKIDFVEQNVKVKLSDIPEENYNLFIKPFISKECLNEIRKSLN